MTVRPSQLVNMAVVPSAWGAAQHALDVGAVALDLYERGDELIALTLVRSAMECALTASWLIQNPEAILGFVGEEYRTRRVLAESMARSATELFRENASTIVHQDEAEIESAAGGQARHFEQLCRALRGGDDAYIHYRLLSGFCHPSAMMTDFYLEPDDTIETGCRLRHEPRTLGGQEGWLFLNVSSMLWGLRALDHVNVSHPHRSRLRKLAAELRIPETLKLTERALQEATRAAQARKRAAWKGPRRKGR